MQTISFVILSTLLVLYWNYSSLSPSDTSQTLSSIVSQSNSSTYNCFNGRFEKDIFKDIKVYKDIVYGRNKNMQSKIEDLMMDIFEPKEDTAQLRPIVIWAHGGYFCFGDKTDFHPLCEFVTTKGWVSVSMNYRKWRKHQMPDSLEYLETAIMATHDMHDAIRFFKADAAGANIYKIDTNKIFVGGYSAGGIMAAQVAYLDDIQEVPLHVQKIFQKNGGVLGNGSNKQHTSTIAGCIVLAGAVYHKNIIIKGNKPPFLGVQGTEDEIVPYAYGWAKSPMNTKVINLDGTSTIHELNQRLGVSSTLLSLPKGNHNAPWDDEWQEQTLQYIHQFLFDNTCNQ